MFPFNESTTCGINRFFVSPCLIMTLLKKNQQHKINKVTDLRIAVFSVCNKEFDKSFIMKCLKINMIRAESFNDINKINLKIILWKKYTFKYNRKCEHKNNFISTILIYIITIIKSILPFLIKKVHIIECVLI